MSAGGDEQRSGQAGVWIGESALTKALVVTQSAETSRLAPVLLLDKQRSAEPNAGLKGTLSRRVHRPLMSVPRIG